MTPCVIDASVAIKWYVPEVHHEAALRLLAQQQQGGLHFHVPDLFLAETGNILWKKLRSQELTPGDLRAITRALWTVPKTIYPTSVLLLAALELAAELDRTVYDCLYLALAGALNCPLVTADLKLYRALRHTPWRGLLTWVSEV